MGIEIKKNIPEQQVVKPKPVAVKAKPIVKKKPVEPADKYYRKLPIKYFDVIVKTYSTITPQEAAIRGIPINIDLTDNKKLPNDALNTDIVVGMTPEQILDVYRSGSPISLVDRSKVNDLYNIFQKFIDDWSNNYHASINVKYDKPVDMINDIDRMLSDIFSMCKRRIASDMVSTTNSFDIGIPTVDYNGRFNTHIPQVYDSGNATSIKPIETDRNVGTLSKYDIKETSSDPYSALKNINTDYKPAWINEYAPNIDLANFNRPRTQMTTNKSTDPFKIER